MEKILFTSTFLQIAATEFNQKSFSTMDESIPFVTNLLQKRIIKIKNALIKNNAQLKTKFDSNPIQAAQDLVTDSLVDDFYTHYYQLETSDDYIYFFEDYPEYVEYVTDSFNNLLEDHLAFLELNAKNINKQEIKTLITSMITELYKDKFDITSSNEDGTLFLIYQLNNNQLQEVINKVFINNKTFNLVNKLLRSVDQNTVDKKIKTKKIANLDDLDLKLYETIDVDEEFFTRLHHDSSYRPLIYINGNVILGDEVDGEERRFHDTLFRAYGNDKKLHTNDIIKMPMSKWKSLHLDSWNVYRKFKGVRAVMQKHNVCTIDGFEFTEEAVAAIKKKYNCKVFAVNYNNDDFGKLKRFAKLMQKKR